MRVIRGIVGLTAVLALTGVGAGCSDDSDSGGGVEEGGEGEAGEGEGVPGDGGEGEDDPGEGGEGEDVPGGEGEGEGGEGEGEGGEGEEGEGEGEGGEGEGEGEGGEGEGEGEGEEGAGEGEGEAGEGEGEGGEGEGEPPGPPECAADGVSRHCLTLIFNEVLADQTAGDANGNNDAPEVGDEFVELIHVGEGDVDLRGWTLNVKQDAPTVRHTFAALMVSTGDTVVLFGGAPDLPDVAGVTWLSANGGAADFRGLGLEPRGNVLTLRDAAGDAVAEFRYGADGGPPYAGDKSLTRAPDGDREGAWIEHPPLAAGDDEQFYSPGTRADGTALR